MTKTRGQWIRFLLAGLSIAVAPLGLDAARAQGFGPDPFRPYNSQYDGYLRPLSEPGLAAGAAASARGGRGDNSFQEYLNQLEGADRATSQRYGIGVPYWQARGDVKRDRLELKANRRAERSPEATLESINQKYLAYFFEGDPRKRAVLLRDFSSTRRMSTRDAPLRREDGSDDRDAASELDSPRRSRSTARGGSDDERPTRSTRGRSGTGAEAGERAIPPPPPLRGLSRGTTKRDRRPTDTLKRSLEDDDTEPGAAPRIRRRTPVRPAPTPPDE